MNENWAVTAEFELGFDLAEDQLGQVCDALNAPCSWDAGAHRFSTTISVRDTPVDAVLARATALVRSALAALTTEDVPRLVAIEALTFEEQDRRLGGTS